LTSLLLLEGSCCNGVERQQLGKGGSLDMYVTCIWVPDITQSKSCILVEVGVLFDE